MLHGVVNTLLTARPPPMSIDPIRTRQHLAAGEFKRLFIEELGWDTHSGSHEILVDGQLFTLNVVAQKRGMVAFLYKAMGQGSIPDYPTRRKIDRQLTKFAQEHLIIYTDSSNSTQVWQWVKRELGKPAACREHTYYRHQTGEALIQKLKGITFTLEEEEQLSLVEVTRRARAAFDVERATKRFYDAFQKEHAAFLKFLKGIPDEEMQRWYASVMLNRLMFVYFIQKKGFLDGNQDYLRTKLTQIQAEAQDRFYQDFLCPLFFEGFAKKDEERSTTMNRLLGKVPYLNGGLFLRHQIEEQHGQNIQVADAAFGKLFDFFDRYHWHLDERPLRRDDEINPDVLGYIFEKYINQKQMGAYYTKEDITGYIGQNTVIPFLFDAARQKCRIAFEGTQSVWELLQLDPGRYIYDPVRKGVMNAQGNVIPETVLPEYVQQGMHDPKVRMFDKRYNLREADFQDAEDHKLTLPTETWREYVERRNRCVALREKLAKGEICEINDLITYNLNIRQFAQDVIENCEGPELLRAFYHAIEKITVLDPTCGSGAFLFAALNILEPLYEACLDRMEVFLDELARSGNRHRPEKFGDFRKILDRVASHPNRRYFILKSIILNNLYGVDIMEEAVEICKLRLFLKLVAQVEKVEQIEPLPDIDFNIRAGNTLVGYAGLEDLKKSMEGDWVSLQSLPTIEENAEIADRAFQKFHEMQTEHGMEAKDFADAKLELQRRLNALEDELNRYLASEYGVDASKRAVYAKWLASHKPFHWFIEFYRIMKSGGFDVIIGNPPWVEYSKVKGEYTIRNYETEPCGNLHGICTERGLHIRSPRGYMSFIVQLPLVSSSRMLTVRNVLRGKSATLHVIPCDDRPGKLFDGLEHCRAVIWISLGKGTKTGDACQIWSTKYQRWPTEMRSALFSVLQYTRVTAELLYADQFPKYAHATVNAIFARVQSEGGETVGQLLQKRQTDRFIFYQEATQYWVKATVGLPYYAKNGRVGAPAHGRYLHFAEMAPANAICATLHSSLFYLYFVAYGDCFHLSDTLVRGFRISCDFAENSSLVRLGKDLMRALKDGAERKEIRTRDGERIAYDEYYGWKAKDCINEIDSLLAQHYGFTDEELDFIINYDIKYRMGQDASENEE